MDKKIQIFKENLPIDLKKLIATRMLVCANSGGGKSWAVRKLVEEMPIQVLILDSEGEFHTLREKYDFLLIGGTQGDIALNPRAAKLYPKSILEQSVSTIVDMSELKHQERIIFVRDFLNALMELPRDLWRPLLVVIDEVHKFCGQQEKQDSTYAVIDLMAQGRKRGFCGVLCTQRISKLHKDAAAEANNYMIGRTSLDIDMKRAADLLGFTKNEQILSLRDLEPGQFFTYGQAICNKIEEVKVGNVKTTHPEPGELLDIKVTPPNSKIKAMLTKLNELPQEAVKQARDLSEANKTIRELEHQIKVMPQKVTGYSEADLAKVKKMGYEEGVSDIAKTAMQEHNLRITYEKKLEAIRKLIVQFNNLAEVPLTIFKDPKKASISVMGNLQRMTIGKNIIKKDEPKSKIVLPHTYMAGSAGTTPMQITGDTSLLGKGEKSILAFLVSRPNTTFTKQQIGAMTGYAHSSGTFNTYLSNLSTQGYIKRDSSGVSLIDEEKARQAVGNFTDDFNIESWLNKLGAGPMKIYKILLENPDTEFSKEEIGEQTGYISTSGTFNTYLSSLATLGLIDRSNGKVKLHEAIQGI